MFFFYWFTVRSIITVKATNEITKCEYYIVLSIFPIIRIATPYQAFKWYTFGYITLQIFYGFNGFYLIGVE